jgi:hypothetical protein
MSLTIGAWASSDNDAEIVNPTDPVAQPFGLATALIRNICHSSPATPALSTGVATEANPPAMDATPCNDRILVSSNNDGQAPADPPTAAGRGRAITKILSSVYGLVAALTLVSSGAYLRMERKPALRKVDRKLESA